MQTTSLKSNILKVVQDLPEETTIEEAMEHLLVLSKIEKGIQQADAGKTKTHRQAEKRMEKWLK